MTVFVTGATGFVGREIVRQLLATGHSVRILARSAKKVPGDSGKVQTFFGDILEADSLAAGLTGADAVVHLVGIISEVGENTFKNVHVRGTENVVTAARRAGVRFFAHMSALGTRPKAIARYHQSKWAAEELVRKSGLAYAIFRPSIIYGPGDQFVNLFARMSRYSPIIPLMGGGHTRFQPIPVADVATCFVKSLTEIKSVGQTFDVCGTEVLTLAEIIDTVLQVPGRRRLKVSIPFPLARCQAAILEFIFSKLLRRASPLNRDQVTMLGEDNVGNPEPIMELFGIKPIPFRQGIAKYLR